MLPSGELVGGHRAGDEVALGLVAAQHGQHLPAVGALQALGHDGLGGRTRATGDELDDILGRLGLDHHDRDVSGVALAHLAAGEAGRPVAEDAQRGGRERVDRFGPLRRLGELGGDLDGEELAGAHGAREGRIPTPSGRRRYAPLAAPAGAATGCADADWAGADLTGSVALVSRGDCTFAQKSQVAAASGAEAVIIYNNAEGALNGTLGAAPGDVVGTVGVTRELGADLLAQTRAGGATVTLDLEQLVEQRPTWNVLAETRTGSDDDVVMLGAHLDGVPEGPGIHDNASGVAATLEVARQAAKANKAESKVRFALWGAEEIGLLGSHHYVDTLTAAEREDIILYTNLDMVAPLDHQNTLGVLTADWSIGAESLLGAQLDRDGHAHQPEGSNGRSDYAPFVDAGIASTGLLSIRDDNYHTPQDDIDNVSITTLTHTARAVANLIGTLQQDADALGTR